MKKREAATTPVLPAQVRSDLIDRRLLFPNAAKTHTVMCEGCKAEFDRLASRPWDQFCGRCAARQYARERKAGSA